MQAILKDQAVAGDPGRTDGLDVARIRRDFPLLSRRMAGDRPLVYLDSAATSQKPVSVIEAVADYYRTSNANVHRAPHRLGEEATVRYENSRRKVQAFIGARGPEEIVFTSGATAAINLVASAWGRSHLGEGDEILLTEMEHHSNLIPWQLLARERGCALRFLPLTEEGTLELESLGRLWSPRTRFVALAQVSNVLGCVNDVKRVIDHAHGHGVPVLVDGAQSVPRMPVDVQDLGCDFLAFSGHKMCGPMGIGVLYGRRELLSEMPPYMGGGEMIRSVWPETATWNDLPHKFEAGTPNVVGAIGLGHAVDYLTAIGTDRIEAYESRLAAHALERLGRLSGVTVHGPVHGRTGVISFTLDGLHPHDIAQYLDREGIAVRAGHHCAQPLMRRLGVPATTRASLYFYNTFEEIDRFVAALQGAREFFGRGS